MRSAEQMHFDRSLLAYAVIQADAQLQALHDDTIPDAIRIGSASAFMARISGMLAALFVDPDEPPGSPQEAMGEAQEWLDAHPEFRDQIALAWTVGR